MALLRFTTYALPGQGYPPFMFRLSYFRQYSSHINLCAHHLRSLVQYTREPVPDEYRIPGVAPDFLLLFRRRGYPSTCAWGRCERDAHTQWAHYVLLPPEYLLQALQRYQEPLHPQAEFRKEILINRVAVQANLLYLDLRQPGDHPRPWYNLAEYQATYPELFWE